MNFPSRDQIRDFLDSTKNDFLCENNKAFLFASQVENLASEIHLKILQRLKYAIKLHRIKIAKTIFRHSGNKNKKTIKVIYEYTDEYGNEEILETIQEYV